MEYDFDVIMSDVSERGVLALELGLEPNGRPIYRVSVFDGRGWTGARYHSFGAAITTYKFLRRVI